MDIGIIFQQTEDCEVGSCYVQVHLIFKHICCITDQGCTNPGHQLTWATKFCVGVRNISVSSYIKNLSSSNRSLWQVNAWSLKASYCCYVIRRSENFGMSNYFHSAGKILGSLAV